MTLYETCYLSANDGQDGCPPGSLCVARSVEQTVGACLPACTNANQCGSGACVSSPFSGLLHCAEPCDPLASACPGSMLCLSTTGQFGCQLPTEDDVGIAGDPCFGPDVRGCADMVAVWPEPGEKLLWRAGELGRVDLRATPRVEAVLPLGDAPDAAVVRRCCRCMIC